MFTVTCKIEGCVNADIAIVLNDVGEVVVCGPCGNIITDIEAAE